MAEKKVFNCTEVFVSAVIVAALTLVGFMNYRGYVKDAMIAEGKTLAGSIARLEKVYYAANGRFLVTGSKNNKISRDANLGIDAGVNTYFKHFYVEVPGKYGSEFSVFTVYLSNNGHDIYVKLHGFFDKASTYETELEQ